MLKLYHAEPVANSLKSLIPLHEKGLAFESVYVDLHKFEQHEPWFVALNPVGQVPVLDHDGILVTHTTVINEYLEDAPQRRQWVHGALPERIAELFSTTVPVKTFPLPFVTEPVHELRSRMRRRCARPTPPARRACAIGTSSSTSM
jgi:glutathione S-transferase